jgi:hypothetical protein
MVRWMTLKSRAGVLLTATRSPANTLVKSTSGARHKSGVDRLTCIKQKRTPEGASDLVLSKLVNGQTAFSELLSSSTVNTHYISVAQYSIASH